MSKSKINRNVGRRHVKIKSQVKELTFSNKKLDFQVKIQRISKKGNGVGFLTPQNSTPFDINEVHVPNTLPGEVVRVKPKEKLGKKVFGDLIEIILPSPHRQLPKCNSYLNCGGCQIQHINYNSYLEWKKESTLKLFQKSNIEIPNFVGLIASEGQKRRRASFKFKRTKEKSYIGFHKSRTHQIIQLDGCVVLSADLLYTKKEIFEGLDKIVPNGTEMVIQVNQYETGGDILLTSDRELSNKAQSELASWASDTKIKRISVGYRGESEKRLIYQDRPPSITWGGIEISPPPGSFLQPTIFGEEILQNQIFVAYKNKRHCLDLFSGAGTLSANLLTQKVRITACDNHRDCLNAFRLGYQKVKQNNLLKTEIRNLVAAPLMSDFLNNFDGIILDPPRSGAYAQIKQIAKSICPSVIYVSCNAISFINDAKILIEGGYRLKDFKILDQFSWTTHIEIIGTFQKE